MKTLRDQVKEYMDARALELGREFSPADMAREVAAHQLDLPERSRCKRQNIETLLDKESKTVRYMVALAAAMGATAEVLAAGQYDASQRMPPRQSHENVAPGPSMRGLVPMISWVQAGNWNHAADPLPAGVSDEWLPCAAKHGSRTYALRVRGDSMTAAHGNSRTYPEDSIIFVDPDRRSPINGDRIIARLEKSDEVTFKVYKNEDGRQWLMALNPAHLPIYDPFAVLGTVIGMWVPEDR